MRVEIVTIGDELLLGFTIDTNAAHLARELAGIGVEIVHRATVGDRADDIVAAVRGAIDRTGAVITTGGLGPTSDDLTKPAIASLFGRELIRDDAIVDAMKARWRALKRTGPFPESNIGQAMIPDGATILINRHGSAPGIWLEDDRRRWVAMLPGVPREMRGMLAEELLPRVLERAVGSESSGTVIRSLTLRTTGIAESALADQLGELARGVDGFELAFLPTVDGVDLRLTSRTLSVADADVALAEAAQKLRFAAGQFVYGEGTADLAEIVLDLCRRRSLRIAVAESCTGGMLGSRLTAIAGSSDVFAGGVIAYENAVKRDWLDVADDLLQEHGAVSEQVATKMAESVRRRMKADIGIGVTGVAGPGGGTASKPVGMVWVGLDGPVSQARCLRLFGTREEVRQRAVQASLDMIRRSLEIG
ncbi:MAG TPA: competence/damage-inducible protein A [Gemmatimonadaceae bacterium]|nr:competence/damage-inducible protein A [Gemmatimonadaceae bacterium]